MVTTASRFVLGLFVALLAFVVLMLALQTGHAASAYEDCPPGVEQAFRQLTVTMQGIKEASRPCAQLRDEFLHAATPDDMRAAAVNAIGEGCW